MSAPPTNRGRRQGNVRVLLVTLLVAAALFFGSIVFIVSRAH